jgi:CrcB protein
MMIKNILLVGFGGAVGSIGRYLVQKYVNEWHPHPFPFATLLVNLSGCFLIGLCYGFMEKGDVLTPEWRLLLTTGLCGGFTTFSSFAYENVTLLKTGDFGYLGLYIAASVILGIAAVFGGIFIFRII